MNIEPSHQLIDMNNIVFITNLATEYDTVDYAEYCLGTWKYWCKKNDVQLIVLDQPLVDTNYMKATWQRWYALDILESNNIKYDQVALVDIDTMIKWDAPNFFNETDHKLGACVDNDNVGWVIDSIEGYQKYFENTIVDWPEYFNCGYVIINETHKSLCKSITSFWSDNSQELTHLQTTLRKGTDQTPVNYLVKKSECDVKLMNKKWNLTHLNRKELLMNFKFVNAGYIWHFNGFDKQHRSQIMRETWNNVKHNYEN